MTNIIARTSLAFIFFYHGLVPKILFKSEQEVLMNNTFMPFIEKEFALLSSGIMEIVYAVLLLIFFNSKKILWPAIIFSILATIAIIIKLPSLLSYAFNPLTLNLSVCALCTISYLNVKSSKA